jgi:hypothetical protein
VTYEDFLAIARSFEGPDHRDRDGPEVQGRDLSRLPVHTPESTGRGQSDGRAAAERFVEQFDRTGSLRPGDYARVSRNASYHIGLLMAAAESRTTPPRT